MCNDNDDDIKDFYSAMNEVTAREGWDDPAMDVYNEKKEEEKDSLKEKDETNDQRTKDI